MSRVAGWEQIKYLLPEMQTAELRLRGRAQALGISYTIPDYAGTRTVADTTQLIQWRDEAVAAARAAAARKAGATTASIDAAGKAAYYRVAPFSAGKHGVGGAFDIRVSSKPATMTNAQAYAALGKVAPELGLIWGGTFSAPADPFHFESNRSREELEDLFVAWQQAGGSSAGETLPKSATATVATKALSIGVVMLTALGVGLLWKAWRGEL